jgi:hypothetical protein
MHAIISQRDFRQLKHITPYGSQSKQSSGFRPAYYLHQLADLFYQTSSPMSVCEPSRSKGYTLPDKVLADDMKAQETHARSWGNVRNNHSGLLRATEGNSDIEPEPCADANKIPRLIFAQRSKLLKAHCTFEEGGFELGALIPSYSTSQVNQFLMDVPSRPADAPRVTAGK